MHILCLLLFCFVAAVTGVSAGSPQQQQTATPPILIVGTFTRDEGWVNGTGKGIYTYKLNTTTGSLTPWKVTPYGVNPIYVQGSTKVFNTGKRVIYVVNSVDDVNLGKPGSKTGYVSAFTLSSDGSLKLLKARRTYGGLPTHISVSPSQNYVVVSNYAGSIAMFPINADGSLAEKTFYQEFSKGSNVVKDRQAEGHIHSSTWLPNSKHVVVANLGSDELLQYKLDEKKQTLKSLRTVKRLPGSGPRHMVCSINMAYVVDELSNTVGVYPIDKNAAVLSTKALQEITTLPSSFTNASTSADIHLSSNGKFLYTSNRGHDSIAMFKINCDGTLTSLGWESTRGKFPRGFVVYEDLLIVANQNSNDMFVFKIDSNTGLLSFTGNSYKIGTAVCLYVMEYLES
ncbi:unnamed protein product [Peronospora belbahrii]|uniref:6-phosphogluconolactonase n=1 Tax=Peronospora belbahrii TaxID=622444 RepID=A0AAU9L232_9STRA|nr:unnamed protein product [Peronospora belbahrii]